MFAYDSRSEQLGIEVDEAQVQGFVISYISFIFILALVKGAEGGEVMLKTADPKIVAAVWEFSCRCLGCLSAGSTTLGLGF